MPLRRSSEFQSFALQIPEISSSFVPLAPRNLEIIPSLNIWDHASEVGLTTTVLTSAQAGDAIVVLRLDGIMERLPFHCNALTKIFIPAHALRKKALLVSSSERVDKLKHLRGREIAEGANDNAGCRKERRR